MKSLNNQAQLKYIRIYHNNNKKKLWIKSIDLPHFVMFACDTEA